MIWGWREEKKLLLSKEVPPNMPILPISGRVLRAEVGSGVWRNADDEGCCADLTSNACKVLQDIGRCSMKRSASERAEVSTQCAVCRNSDFREESVVMNDALRYLFSLDVRTNHIVPPVKSCVFCQQCGLPTHSPTACRSKAVA